MRRSKWYAVRVTAILMLLASGCTTTPPPSTPQNPVEPAEHTALLDAGVTEEAPPLDVQAPSLQTDGRVAKIRATVRNPYDEAALGIVYFIAIANNDKILEVVRRDSTGRIGPGGRIIARLDVESMYWGSGSIFFQVFAFPTRMGNRDVVLPDMVAPPSD